MRADCVWRGPMCHTMAWRPCADLCKPRFLCFVSRASCWGLDLGLACDACAFAMLKRHETRNSHAQGTQRRRPGSGRRGGGGQRGRTYDRERYMQCDTLGRDTCGVTHQAGNHAVWLTRQRSTQFARTVTSGTSKALQCWRRASAAPIIDAVENPSQQQSISI